MFQQNKKVTLKQNQIRRYNVSGSRNVSNYWWSNFSIIGGFSFFIVGLYSYYLNFVSNSNPFSNTFLDFIPSQAINTEFHFKILFFPQGLSMCFYGLAGLLIGAYLRFCISLGVGCGFTEFNKEKNIVRIFRLGFPGHNRYIDYTYALDNIQCICVRLSFSVVSTSQRGVYMRIKNSDNQVRDIPLDLYSEKTSLETIEAQAANLSKFLRISLSTQ